MKKTKLIIEIIFIAVLFWWVIFKFDIPTAKTLAAALNPLYGFWAVLSLAVSQILLAVRWQMILRGFFPESRLSIAKLFWYNMLAVFYSIVFPTALAGEAVRVVKCASNLGRDYVKVSISALFDRGLGAVIWLIVFFTFPSPLQNNYFWFLIPTAALIIFFVKDKFVILGNQVFDFARHHPGDIALAFLCSLSGQFFSAAAVFFVLRCFNIDLSFVISVGITSVGALASAIPLSLFGVGIRESSYLGTLPAYGYTHVQAVFVMAFLVLLNYVFGLAAGLVELSLKGWSLKKLLTQAKGDIDSSTGSLK